MTSKEREEAIKYFEQCNSNIISVCKDENNYDYEKQEIISYAARKTYEANKLAIEALELEKEFDYYKSQCESYEGTINKLTETIADNKSDDSLLIIKSVGFLTKEDLEYVCNEIAEQRKLGVVVLRQGWDAVLVPSDVEIKFEEREGKS